MLSPEAKAVKRRIYKHIGIGVKKFSLIKNGDKLLFGFSGGEDSFVLTDYLYNFKKTVPMDIKIKLVTVDMEFPDNELVKVKSFLKENYNFELTIIGKKIPSIVREKMEGHKNSCVLCSRLRRGFLYDVARKEGYNKLVLAHNGDDVIETLLLNIFYNGKIKGMPPVFLNNDKDVTLIRPMYYVFKRDIGFYAESMEFPIIKTSCPLSKFRGNKRVIIKNMLDKLEVDFDRVRNNSLKSMEKIEKRFLPFYKELFND